MDPRRVKVALIGAGPIGIEVAAGLKRAGVDYLHIEKGPLAATIYRWPQQARFLSSPERVAIAGVPVASADQEQLTREDYLAYLRGVAELFELEIHTYNEVIAVTGEAPEFRLQVRDQRGVYEVEAEAVVLATGDMGEYNRLGIPGEELPQVAHVLEDPHLYFGSRLLIVGGKNSGLEAALRCFRAGVRVSLSYRKATFDQERVNSRLFLELSILTDKGTIPFYPETVPEEISPQGVRLRRTTGETLLVESDFVLLATGYRADLRLMRELGVPLNSDGVPVYDPGTMESAVKGVYLAGTAVSGARERYKDFIGTSHHHAAGIVKDLTGRDVPTGTIPSRRYSFSLKDIEAD